MWFEYSTAFPELQARTGKFFTFRQVGQNFAAELGEMAKDQSIVPPLAPSGRGLSAKPTGGEKSLWRLSLRRPAGDTSLTEGGKREGQSPSPTHFVSDGLLLSVATKVTKNAIQGGRKFRSSFPLENPPSLNDQMGRGCCPSPLENPTQGEQSLRHGKSVTPPFTQGRL